jgi:very-short-patch-repair endonuclease
MNIKKTRFTELIKNFKLKELFNELGWENVSMQPVSVKIDEDNYNLTAVAQKRGFLIFQCSYNSQGKIPTKDIRKKIDTKISKIYFEHLIIYSDKNNTQQIWQLVIREQDKPIIVRETDYFSTQHPELLFQKLRGIFISLDDEDKITLADVRANVREQFNTNAERVTRSFYTQFQTQHTAFLKFIKGIEDRISKEWYASLMLNRLMFIYFIQKKGFLDDNLNYLSDKLKEIRNRKGKDKFFSFYRNFLLVLFHKGLGSPERSEQLLKELGKVPYLNGGLFDVHQIEKEYKNIEIEDKAFEKIFAFFDEYNWHLDNRVTASGRDINPDVIGYIFEKYINDRAAMGAYYTKEDITEYIAKNTIIPFLFDEVKKDCANAFKDESSLWKMLRENPDKYIYDAVKHGVDLTPLPPLKEGNFGIPPTLLQEGSFKYHSLRGDLGVFDKDELEIYKNHPRPIPKWYEIPYNKELVMTARELRKAGNKAEIIFWLQVKNKQILSLDFDRQKVVGNFIVDFFCKNLAVAVEIDGSSHNDKVEYDIERDNFLKSVGLIVIHYTDRDVINNIEGVLEDLKLKLIEIAKLSGIDLTPLTPLKRGIGTPLQVGKETPLNLLQEERIGTPPTPLKRGDSEVPSLRGDLGVFEEMDLDNPNHPLWKNFPDEIKQGFRPDLKDKIVVADDRPHLWEIRKEWNKPAPSEIALPTEIWREVIERHKRYFEQRRKITNGEIKEINDFITYNLNIRQFAQDAVEQYEGSDFINAFYKAITKITVLDPTCGSGAFLFAALNILEPLYYACIERMKGFIELDDLQGGKKFPQFRKVIEDIKQHPSQQYYIYKSIILNNLYGVDIMNEAVEIAKLRLFLKLVAEVDEFDHLEPLPDIDFNIRTGNTLIGYANRKEIEELEGLFVTDAMKKKIFDECDLVARAFQRFKEIQLDSNSNKTEFSKAKEQLNERLNKLKKELDKILHKQHYEGIEYNKWLSTHKPFHWFAEFYEIMEDGGFDVIIGNPPYVEYPNKKIDYELKNFTLLGCGNLYAYVVEKLINLISHSSKWSLIIPSSAYGTERMKLLREFINYKSISFVSFFGNRPATLFSGAQQNLCIPIWSYSQEQLLYSSKHTRWNSDFRDFLFDNIRYCNNKTLNSELFHKFGNEIELAIHEKTIKYKNVSNFLDKYGKFFVYYSNAAGYWLHSITKLKHPAISRDKVIKVHDQNIQIIYSSLINSDIFFWYWQSLGDCYHITNKETHSISIPIIENNNYTILSKIAKNVENDLLKNMKVISTNEKTGISQQEEFYPKLSKGLINELSTVLGSGYLFTEEELDFIINYDIKYRMGKQNEEEI